MESTWPASPPNTGTGNSLSWPPPNQKSNHQQPRRNHSQTVPGGQEAQPTVKTTTATTGTPPPKAASIPPTDICNAACPLPQSVTPGKGWPHGERRAASQRDL